MATDTSNFNFQGIGVVTNLTVIGCTQPLALNYDPLATVDDGSCVGIIYGCMDPLTCAGSYNPLANFQPIGACDYCCPTYSIPGCSDPTACNYNPTALCDDGSCTGTIGCTNDEYDEYDAAATCGDDATWCLNLLGCMDPAASNYNSLATVNDPNNPCIACVYGCMDCGTLWETINFATCPGGAATLPGSTNFDLSVTCDDGSCNLAIYGCTDPTATAATYNPLATVDDGSCVYTIYGCTDPLANNYNPLATIDDGSCTYDILGCTDALACNYDAAATVDDGSCVLPAGCDDPLYLEYDPLITYCPDNTNACITLIVNGCTDCGTIWEGQNPGQFCDGVSAASGLGATNYDPLANVNSGCTYPVLGCMDSTVGVNPDVNGSGSYFACNYDPSATMNDPNNPCTYPIMPNEDCAGNCLSGFIDLQDGAGCVAIVIGCTDPAACNYDALANIDDGLCLTDYGCTDPNAPNYDSTATCDDGSCIVCSTLNISVGSFLTHNTDATTPNGSAVLTPSVIADDTFPDGTYTYTFSDSAGNTSFTTSTSGTTTTISGLSADTYTIYITTASGCTSTSIFTIADNITILGCTDPTASNYSASATVDDGSCIYIGSYTEIPDANFRQILNSYAFVQWLNSDINYDPAGGSSGWALTTDLAAISTLQVSSGNISDLTGIEDFSGLTYLHVGDNNLTSLDLSFNNSLIYLYCYANQLTSLDVSNHTNLYILQCRHNNLTSLDVSNNTSLYNLYCHHNNLTSLDVSANTALGQLWCYQNQLTSLKLVSGASTNFNVMQPALKFKTNNNPNLTCIEVTDPTWSTTNWTVAGGSIDATMSFSSYGNC